MTFKIDLSYQIAQNKKKLKLSKRKEHYYRRVIKILEQSELFEEENLQQVIDILTNDIDNESE